MPSACSRCDRLDRLRPDLVLDAERAENASLHDHVQRPSCPAPSQPRSRRRLAARDRASARAGAAHRPRPPRAVDAWPRAPRPGERLESSAVGQQRCARPCGGDDCPCQWVLGVGLDRARRAEQLCPRRRLGRDHAASAGRPSVSVPVLSKMMTLELARLFERDPVLDEQAVARAERGRDGDHQRDRQAQRVGTRDDQHGDGGPAPLAAVPSSHQPISVMTPAISAT